ncbi:hypothetical protein M406DRAFT_75728 [Cryphonectria parasitica EP155]|uniref:JmjC domain-containing protein n=1 Tax=Cryphonectria parasitica (strain ATCC 38755 / EP155) TaxID=660469 RepID=A0A9P4Y936_CRYP1|nr:uncharacterized protein M406DRAFT_75728 [Cryphonectria parasitica EP155]KAF3769237.1 hypothetical protein M406DRAFT_75728 [Cryphonectria parasitica EP155]
MAHRHPGARPLKPLAPRAPDQLYSQAFLQTCDEPPTRPASDLLKTRDSPALARPVPKPLPTLAPAPASDPALVTLSWGVPASASASTLVPNSRPSDVFHSPASHVPHPSRTPDEYPTTLELAEGLIMMRSSVEPMSAKPSRIPFAHPSTQPHVALNSGLAPFPMPRPLNECAFRASDPDPVALPAAPALPVVSAAAPAPAPAPTTPLEPLEDRPNHPPVSTSSEENAGRHSDIFSMGENSDTISDPDVDSAERTLQGSAPQHSMTSAQQVPQQGAPPVEIAPQEQTSTPPVVDGRHVSPRWPYPSTISREELGPGVAGIPVDDPPAAAQPTSFRLYDPATPILPEHGTQCNCRAVPEPFIAILDEEQPADVRILAKYYGACKEDLCPLHLDAYARLITSALGEPSLPTSATMARPLPTVEKEQDLDGIEVEQIPTLTGSATKWTTIPVRRRATSTPGIYEFELELPAKRRRTAWEDRPPQLSGKAHHLPHSHPLESLGREPRWEHLPRHNKAGRPIIDVERDERFRRQVMSELAEKFTDTKEDDWLRGETTNRLVHAILSTCRSPNTDPSKGPVDADLLSGEEALDAMERGTQRIPIFTEGQQQFQWTDNGARPIEQLFHRMEDLSREVSVQIPSRNFDLASFEKRSLADIKARFLRNSPSQDPWNILDLRSPLPHSILPSFLTGENCQLLPRIRDSLLEGHSAERTKASREDWNEWTELLEWVLVSEGGHNTSPHMDSHGWSTWITIQEGEFGFGWLSRPTEEEQNAWVANPLSYTGGRWRFVILRPGQTVFFPTGTVHFVFRLHAKQTLAVGGHLLQWTGLERWAQIILLQLKNPDTTNEDLDMSTLKYVRSASEMVNARTLSSRIEPLGGMPTVQNFMAWVTEIERWYKLEADKNERKKKKKKRIR